MLQVRVSELEILEQASMYALSHHERLAQAHTKWWGYDEAEGWACLVNEIRKRLSMDNQKITRVNYLFMQHLNTVLKCGVRLHLDCCRW